MPRETIFRFDFLFGLCAGCNSFATQPTSKTAHSTAHTLESTRCQQLHWHACQYTAAAATAVAARRHTSCAPIYRAAAAMLTLLAFLSSALAAPAAATAPFDDSNTAIAQASSAANASLVVPVGHVQDKVEQGKVNKTQQRNIHKRHSKRHSNWYEYYNENSTNVEWQNPCGGVFVELTVSPKRENPLKLFNNLRTNVRLEYNSLVSTTNIIKEKDVNMWKLHASTFKFLPKLKNQSRIALKRWHRNMQTYVASIAYLLREQLKYTQIKWSEDKGKAHELKNLLLSSRRMLCALEMTVNGTQPRHKQHLRQFSREEMNQRLKLITKHDAELNPVKVLEPNEIDLVYVKYYYLAFLRKMRFVLREKTKRTGQMNLAVNRKEFNEVHERRSLNSRSSGRSSLAHDNDQAAVEQQRVNAKTPTTLYGRGTLKRLKPSLRRMPQVPTLSMPLHRFRYAAQQK